VVRGGKFFEAKVQRELIFQFINKLTKLHYCLFKEYFVTQIYLFYYSVLPKNCTHKKLLFYNFISIDIYPYTCFSPRTVCILLVKLNSVENAR
jgi:hypothetical protein